MQDTINVSEIFHSIQGEGSTQGLPSVFLRLQACNLMCGGQGTEKDKELHNGATWRCDTIEVWREGNGWSVDNLIGHLQLQYGSNFLRNSQLVITGGEPMLQQEQFPYLINGLERKLAKKFRVEIETNGTIVPSNVLGGLVDQYNVSPKLANSGMPKERRYKPEALQVFADMAERKGAIFKFVVSREEDVTEVLKDFIYPLQLKSSQVWLMPGCSNQEQYNEVAPLVASICQETGLNFSSRLQINLWNMTTGV